MRNPACTLVNETSLFKGRTCVTNSGKMTLLCWSDLYGMFEMRINDIVDVNPSRLGVFVIF